MASFKASASSSSSSKPTGGQKYEYNVFLSFRGEDTRNNFVDHLYTTLVQKGIRAFKDDKMIRPGRSISPELLKAIEESEVAVVVFSKDYANSSWCLEELDKIMECKDQKGQRVLPVFYHLDPSYLCGQKRDFATAFEKQEEKYKGEMDKLNNWRKALSEAASISGYHISTVSGAESMIINNIVQEILGYIQPRVRENNLIGIESHMDKLNSLLSIEAAEEVRFIGIFGMGGIGKTTIARALFRRIGNKFDGRSFINDVRENSSSKRDICALQEMILKDILVMNQGFTIKDPEVGAEMIQDRFSNKKVLLVLDDVDGVRQLEFLAATHKWFGPGSRIIITTRDEHLLSDSNAKYKPALLLKDQAVELFSRHAFRKNRPLDEFKELSKRAIHYAGRLPLALKVLGSFFRGKKVDVWESALNRLAKTPNREIFDTLKLSFNGLEESEKQIFLDIACFFKGREADYVTRVLDSFGFDAKIGVNSLIDKSFITVSEYRLDMHDLIQEMGWEVVRKSAPNSRLWKNEEIRYFIIENKIKLESIEAIVDPEQLTFEPKQGFSANVFESMKNLRLLHVIQNFTCCEPTLLPHELRWLCWNYYPFSSLPLANMHKLVGIQMFDAKLEHLWNGQKIMPNLKFITLEFNRLSRFPDVSGAPNIERLVLKYCYSLVELDESIGFLKRLVYLDMSYCNNLKRLPSRMEMESLQTIILYQCGSLEKLPEFSPCMVKLSNVDASGCYHLEELPSSIRYLSNLKILDLSNCSCLNTIPDSIFELKCLEALYLSRCYKLQTLPDEFGSIEKLQDLKHLHLDMMELGDQEFPNLYGLSSLEDLSLCGNSKLSQLPASISFLPRLKYLDLRECQHLQSFCRLPSEIQALDASSCISVEIIENLSEEYEWLRKIHLFGCKKLFERKENKRYLDEMLKQSFLNKWAARDGCLSIGIPGSKIPSWFKEQHDGNKIALKLPLKWQTKIKGFAICGVFRESEDVFPIITFKFENGGKYVPMLNVESINASVTSDDGDENMSIGYVPFSLLEQMHDDKNWNVWIAYVPFVLFEKMHDDDYMCEDCEDWSYITEGRLVIKIFDNHFEAERCGVHAVYKEDVESTQQIIKSSISSYYCNWKLEHGLDGTYTMESEWNL